MVRVLAVLLAFVALIGIVSGDAFNGLTFDLTSPLLASAMAGVWGGVLLVAWMWFGKRRQTTGPRLFKGFGRPMWKLIARMAFSNTFVLPLGMLALQRLLRLGTLTSIVNGGPLVLSAILIVVAGKGLERFVGLLWPPIAAAGVLLLTRPWEGHFDWLGLLMAVGAAVCYVNFLLVYDRMGEIDEDRCPEAANLAYVLGAIALTVLSAITLTVLWVQGASVQGVTPPASGWLSGKVLLYTFLAGLLTGPIAQSAQNLIFGKRLLSLETFTMLTSTEPIIGLMLDWTMFKHRPTLMDWQGIALVCGACLACIYQREVRSKRAGSQNTT